MSTRLVSLTPTAAARHRLLHNASVFYPGLVLAPATPGAAGVGGLGGLVGVGSSNPPRKTPVPGDAVLYSLRGPCDDRNLFPVTPTGPGDLGDELVGAIVLQQVWGDSFYHWMIECLPRLASLPSQVVLNRSVAVLVPELHGFIVESLGLLGIQKARLRLLTHATYYTAQDVWLPAPGVCGLGPASLLLRRMNRVLHASLRERSAEESGECVLVRREDGHGRNIENHPELLDALNLLPSVCYGRWQVVSPVSAGGGGSMMHVAQIFATARVVVAPHGGTLSNLLFSKGSPVAGDSQSARVLDRGAATAAAAPDSDIPMRTCVLELLPSFRPNLCYERLCRALGMPYMGMVVPDTSYSQAMRVDVLQVLMSLQQLLEHA